MKIILIYPDDLGKQTEDEIINWMMAMIKNWSCDRYIFRPIKYANDFEVER